ncbi:hypothetical protein M0R72_17045 [Candidatus Pacearchaeota archaeon]|jgi:hypothetical protein|nr:hypothetical protein [Candidatus Pacearchaeota archaeon]
MNDEFYLSRKEFAAMQKFMAEHEHANIFILKYTGTGIGVHTDIICSECQKEEDVTDYDEW